jgi:hypothetical protein
VAEKRPLPDRFALQIASGGPKPRVEQLEMQTRLFRDGVQVWESAAARVETDAKRPAGRCARGSREVPKGLDAGRYVVRVDVGDKADTAIDGGVYSRCDSLRAGICTSNRRWQLKHALPSYRLTGPGIG